MVRLEGSRARTWLEDGRVRAAVLITVAAAVRLVYLFVLTDDGAAWSDAGQYHEIATHLSEGRGFWATFPQLEPHPTAFRPPIYPAVLAIPYALLWPSVVIGKLVNVVIGVGVVVLTDRVGRRVGGRAAGFVAALLVAVYPPLVANDVNLLTEPLSLLLILTATLLLLDERVLWAGAVVGVLVLTRPSAQLLVVAAGVWVWWRLGWRKAAQLAAVTILVSAPWMVRNAVQLDTATLVTSNGFNLAAVYSEPAQETGQFVDPIFDPRFESYRLSQFDEVRWDREMREVGLDGLRSNPSYIAHNVGRNLLASFELRPSWNQTAEWFDGRNHRTRTLALPFFYAVTVLGAIGLWRHRREPGVQLVAGGALYFTAASLVLVAPPRLRAPLDLACCLGTGLLLADVWRQRQVSSRLPSASASDRPVLRESRT